LPKFLEVSLVNDPNTHFELTINISRNLLSRLDDGVLDIIVVPEMPFPSNEHVQQLSGIEITLFGKPGLVPAGSQQAMAQRQ